jgi:hypothetical protein
MTSAFASPAVSLGLAPGRARTQCNSAGFDPNGRQLFHRRSKWRTGLGDKARLGKRYIFVRAASVECLAGILELETEDSSSRGSIVIGLTMLPRSCNAQVIKVSLLRGRNAQIDQRSNVFRTILAGLGNGDSTHAVASQNRRLCLRAGDFTNAIGVAFQRYHRRECRVMSMPRQIRRENIVTPSFEQ